MIRATATAAIVAISILITPAMCLAQGAGGTCGNAGGSPSATAPGTNSAGTAQSSGSGVNTTPGMTTGSSGGLGTGTAATPQTNSDAAINQENKTVDRKLKSICRGC